MNRLASTVFLLTAPFLLGAATPGFRVAWKGENGKFVEVKLQQNGNSMTVIIKAHKFGQKKQGRDAARSAIDQAQPQLVRNYRQQVQKQGGRLTKTSQNEGAEGGVLKRVVQFSIGQEKAAGQRKPTGQHQQRANSTSRPAQPGTERKGSGTKPPSVVRLPESVQRLGKDGLTGDRLRNAIDQVNRATQQTIPRPGLPNVAKRESAPVSNTKTTPDVPKPSSDVASTKSRSSDTTPVPKRSANPNEQLTPQPAHMLLVDQPTTTLAGGSSATITSSLRFSPDGKLLLAVGDNGNSKLWGTDDWKIIPADPKSRTGLQSGWFIKSGAFSPDSKLLACVEGESFEFLKIWNLDSSPLSLAGQARMAGRNNINWHDAIWTKNGDTLITRGPKGRLKCWGKKGSTGTVNVAVAGTSIIGDGRPKERHFGVNSVHCSPDGKLLATAFEHGIQIWSIPSGQEVRWIGRPQPESQWVYHSLCGFSPDGKMLAATLERNSSKETDYKGVELIRLWDTSTWNEAGTLDGANAGGINFKFRAFSPDSRLVISTAGSTWNNTVAIWDAASGAKLQQFKTTSIGNVVFGPDSTMLVTGGHDYLLNNRLYNVNIWNAQTGQLTTRISDLTISTVAVSPDGKWVATGCGENEIKLWNLSNGKRVPYRDEYDANKGNVTSSKGDGNGGTITADQYRSIQPGTLRFAVHKTIGKPYDYKHDFSTRTNRGQSGTNFGTSAVNTFKEYYSLKGHPDKVAEFLYEGPSTNPPLQRTGIRQRQ